MEAPRAAAAVRLLVAAIAAIGLVDGRDPEQWGPAHLLPICDDWPGWPGGERCHRYGKIATPVDHDDPSQGEWDMAYFVNSKFWDPVEKPNGPIFINMGYGSTESGLYTRSALWHIDDLYLNSYFVGTSAALAEELGALIINVPNRYFGCETARDSSRSEGSCPTSLDEIPEGEAGVVEALERLRFLTMRSVVDDLAHVARHTITTYASDWGMAILDRADRAPNQPIVFGCSWPGAAAVYARLLHPEVFPGAVATSHPLVSSPDGNPYYRSFVGSVYELYSAGGSLECRNLLSVGHQEIRRRIEEEGVDMTPIGSCFLDCKVSETVNEDFAINEGGYRSFGGGIPGLPQPQTINRDCSTLGCDIESTCDYLLQCLDDYSAPAAAADEDPLTFPLSVEDPREAAAAYKCLVDFSAAMRAQTHEQKRRHTPIAPPNATEGPLDERALMMFDPDVLPPARRGGSGRGGRLVPQNNLGPRVYDSNTLTYQMFGYRGPLLMTQTCDDGSGCPFVQGRPGGSTYDQTNAWLWVHFGRPGQTLPEFVQYMRSEAFRYTEKFGGQRPWQTYPDMSNIYMVYNDADPWTAPGVLRDLPAERNLTYDLGGGGVAHCVYPALGAQPWIRWWASKPVVGSN